MSAVLLCGDDGFTSSHSLRCLAVDWTSVAPVNDNDNAEPDHASPEAARSELYRLATDPEFRPSGWTVQEIKEFRRLVQCARAAQIPSDLVNMRSLRVQLNDGDPSRGRATLTSGRVIHLTFNNAVTFEEPKP